MGKSILQEWVTELGLRHQGVLLTIVRGCDTAPKHDASKLLTQALRGLILNAHCGDEVKPATFIERVDAAELVNRARRVQKDLDHLPHHYVMHLVHAVEILGYYHPEEEIQGACFGLYALFCRGLHVPIESRLELDDRLNASESEFLARDRA